MANPQGTPIWYELMTTDADAAQAFYAEVVSWTIAPFATDATAGYRILTAPDGQGVGGLMTVPEGAPMKPGWYGYVGVDDVDATAEKVKALGGAVHIAPMDIPGVGRFAFVADPQGMTFHIMRGDSPQDAQAFAVNAPGHCGWNELVTTDHRAALAFYGALFDWASGESLSMGPMGDYAFVDHHGTRIGATMTAGSGWPTRWTYYFTVASIDAAKQRVERAGGTITMGPQEVPGPMFVIMGTDPQGVAFALVGGK